MRLKLLPTINIIFALGLIILGIFVGWPQHQEFFQLRGELKQKVETVKEKSRYINELREADKRLEEYTESISKIEAALPSMDSQPAVFDFFQRITQQNGLILENISTGQGPQSSSSVMEVNLSLSGSYTSFKNFLNEIHANERMIELSLMSFSSGAGLNGLFDFDVRLTGNYLNTVSSPQATLPPLQIRR